MDIWLAFIAIALLVLVVVNSQREKKLEKVQSAQVLIKEVHFSSFHDEEQLRFDVTKA